uniref:Uncharacterized protein n=1 Tax=Daphnia galeata TaxID=27404 RepID=A0A8J2RDV0_9CRUS|nr:unnamed protein product [Daphnia galeata]
MTGLNTRTGLRSQLSWHRLPGGNNSAKDSGVIAKSGARDAVPVFDDDGDQDDAMTQTCALDRWAASLPHIDSDVSDDDDDGYCCEYESQEYATGLVLPELTITSGVNQTRPGVQPTNIVRPEQTEPTTTTIKDLEDWNMTKSRLDRDEQHMFR